MPTAALAPWRLSVVRGKARVVDPELAGDGRDHVGGHVQRIGEERAEEAHRPELEGEAELRVRLPPLRDPHAVVLAAATVRIRGAALRLRVEHRVYYDAHG